MKKVQALVTLALITVLSIITHNIYGFSVLAIFGVLLFFGLMKKPAGAAFEGGIDVELWHNWIKEKFWADNSFLNYARNADEYVIAGKVVHIPQAGDASDVEVNRTQLPAAVVHRTDTDILYALDEFTSNPRLLTDADTILSYNKMDSCLGQDRRKLSDLVAREMAYRWAPTASMDYIINTTGGNIAAHLPSATGNRKLLELKNIDEAVARLNDIDAPLEGRYALISSRMHAQLVGLFAATQYKDFSAYLDPKLGIVGMYNTIRFVMRSKVLTYMDDAIPVVKATDAAAVAATDCDGILIWQMDAVERAIGDMKIFEKLKDPQYFGDIYSLLIRAGGRKVDKDGDGVIAIVQDVA